MISMLSNDAAVGVAAPWDCRASSWVVSAKSRISDQASQIGKIRGRWALAGPGARCLPACLPARIATGPKGVAMMVHGILIMSTRFRN